jgi:hypothetical protein
VAIKILAFIAILVLGSVAVQQLSKRSVDEVLLKGRIRLAAETAKEKNESEITISAPIPIYAEVRDLDAALAKYSTVIVRLVSRHSFISSDTKEITTWYKFEVTDFLSQPMTAKSCNSCPSAKSMPSEVSPTKENEILLVRLVGTVVEGGVRVTSVDRNFPDFQFNKQYLLFIEMDLHTRIATVQLGPAGVSIIEPDGQISSVSSATRLNSELRKRFGKVENVKSALRFRRFPEH